MVNISNSFYTHRCKDYWTKCAKSKVIRNNTSIGEFY